MSQCPTPFGEGDRDMGRCAPGAAAERRLGLRPCGSEFASLRACWRTSSAVARPQPAAGCAAGFPRVGSKYGKPSRSRHRPLWAIFRRPPATVTVSRAARHHRAGGGPSREGAGASFTLPVQPRNVARFTSHGVGVGTYRVEVTPIIGCACKASYDLAQERRKQASARRRGCAGPASRAGCGSALQVGVGLVPTGRI